MSWDVSLWDAGIWDTVVGGETPYYYRKYFWKHLPTPDPIPPVPDHSKVDWSYKAVAKSKLERRIKEVLKE